MAESTTGKNSNNWWKSLTVRKKPKDVSVYSGSSENVESWGNGGGSSISSSPGSRENQHPNSMHSGSTEFNSDAKSDKTFNEKTGRRNLKISRSGRFKEKRKVRASLPESPKFFQENPSHGHDERQ